MGEKNGQPTCSDATRAQLEVIASGTHIERLAGQLGHRHRSRSDDEIQEAIQEALARAHRACRGTHEGEVYTWLWRTADHYLVDRRRAAAREVAVAGDSPALVEVPDPEPLPEQTALKRESKAQLRIFFESVEQQLTPRQRDVLSLHSRGVKRPEVARTIGASPRIVKRELERVLTTARAGILDRVGAGCGQSDSLVVRLAFGLAKGSDAVEAQAHVLSCPACQALLSRLESWREAAAAVLPAPVVKDVEPGLMERAIRGAADGLGSLKQQAVDGTAHMKQQATGAYYRAVDPTPVAGLRPGAAATAIAGCLAIGGGATYCLEQGVNPIGNLPGIVEKAPEREQAGAPTTPAAEQPPAPPVVTPPAQPAPDPQAPQPAPAPRQAEQETSPPPPEQVFEPAAPGAAAAAPKPASRQPAPPPGDGMAEFGGP